MAVLPARGACDAAGFLHIFAAVLLSVLYRTEKTRAFASGGVSAGASGNIALGALCADPLHVSRDAVGDGTGAGVIRKEHQDGSIFPKEALKSRL